MLPTATQTLQKVLCGAPFKSCLSTPCNWQVQPNTQPQTTNSLNNNCCYNYKSIYCLCSSVNVVENGLCVRYRQIFGLSMLKSKIGRNYIGCMKQRPNHIVQGLSWKKSLKTSNRHVLKLKKKSKVLIIILLSFINKLHTGNGSYSASNAGRLLLEFLVSFETLRITSSEVISYPN